MITYAKYFWIEISIFSTSKFLELTLHYRYSFQSRFLQFVKNTNLFTLFDKHCFDITSITETWEITVIGASFDNRCGSSTSIVITTNSFDNRCGSSTLIVVITSAFDNRCGSSTSIVVTTSAFDNRCRSSTSIVVTTSSFDNRCVTASRRHIDRRDRRRDRSPNNAALGRLVYIHKNER